MSASVQVSSHCKVPMASAINMRMASSLPLWARISLTWVSTSSASRVCCSVNGIAACLRMSQGRGHVTRHGVHSVHAMLSGVSPHQGIMLELDDQVFCSSYRKIHFAAVLKSL